MNRRALGGVFERRNEMSEGKNGLKKGAFCLNKGLAFVTNDENVTDKRILQLRKENCIQTIKYPLYIGGFRAFDKRQEK